MRTKTLAIASAAAVAASFAAMAAEDAGTSAGFWLTETINISPFVDVSYGRDDNPNSMREYSKVAARKAGKNEQIEEADLLIIKGGLNLLMPGNHWRLDGRAFVNHEKADGADVDDRTDYSESLILKGWTDAGTTWYLRELFQDIRYDNEFELSQDDRKVLSLGAGGDMSLTDKSKILINGKFIDYNYSDDANLDYQTLGGNIGFAHVLTEKTDWTASIGYRTYDKDTYESDAWGTDVRLGLRSRSTDKLTFDTSVGVDFYRDYEYPIYDAAGNKIGKEKKGEDEKSFVYSIGANWKIAPRLSLRVTGDAGYEPSSDINDNSYLYNSIGAVVRYKPGDHWALQAGIAYERDDYNRNVVDRLANSGVRATSVDEGGVERKDDEFRYFAKASYALNRYCSLFASWTYTDLDSSVNAYDYDRQRYSAGVSLKY